MSENKGTKDDVEYILKETFLDPGGPKRVPEYRIISLNEEMIARFIGFYLMGIEIPEDLWQYICKVDRKQYHNLSMFFDVILNSFDEKDAMIRKMAIDFIR